MNKYKRRELHLYIIKILSLILFKWEFIGKNSLINITENVVWGYKKLSTKVKFQLIPQSHLVWKLRLNLGSSPCIVCHFKYENSFNSNI